VRRLPTFTKKNTMRVVCYYGFYLGPNDSATNFLFILRSRIQHQYENDRIGLPLKIQELYLQNAIEKPSKRFYRGHALNNKMTINLTVRYYWSYSKNHEFFTPRQLSNSNTLHKTKTGILIPEL
jgi:hypothetical protein